MMSAAEIRERATWFAGGKPAAELLFRGPDERFAVLGWFPKLRGQLVRNADDPPDGFRARSDAVAAARRYRQSCADFMRP